MAGEELALDQWETDGGYVYPYYSYQDAFETGDPVELSRVERVARLIIAEIKAG